jgi:hypothetical protein
VIENDRLIHLAELAMEGCPRRRIITPPARALERVCVEVRFRVRCKFQQRLTDWRLAEQRLRLSTLTPRPAGTSQTWLSLLHQMPEATEPVAMLGLIERLEHARGRNHPG